MRTAGIILVVFTPLFLCQENKTTMLAIIDQYNLLYLVDQNSRIDFSVAVP